MTYKINAAWEKRDGRSICRYMIVWKEIAEDKLAGALGGYSGGGSFQMEQFFAIYNSKSLINLMIDNKDVITGQEIDFFDDVPEEFRKICDDAQDVIFEWNEQEKWEDDDQLILKLQKEQFLRPEGDMLILASDKSDFLKKILSESGITSWPSAG